MIKNITLLIFLLLQTTHAAGEFIIQSNVDSGFSNELSETTTKNIFFKCFSLKINKSKPSNDWIPAVGILVYSSNKEKADFRAYLIDDKGQQKFIVEKREGNKFTRTNEYLYNPRDETSHYSFYIKRSLGEVIIGDAIFEEKFKIDVEELKFTYHISNSASVIYADWENCHNTFL